MPQNEYTIANIAGFLFAVLVPRYRNLTSNSTERLEDREKKKRKMENPITAFEAFVQEHATELEITVEEYSVIKDYLLNLFNQNILELDKTIIFIGGKDADAIEKEEMALSLKEVFNLVCAATLDISIHAQEDNEATSSTTPKKEQLQQARVLIQILRELKVNPRSPQETSYELLRALNGIYPGADFIENLDSSLEMLIIEFLATKLKLQPPPRQRQLQLLGLWANSDPLLNKNILYAFFNTHRTELIAQLKTFLAQHYINPEADATREKVATITDLNHLHALYPPLDSYVVDGWDLIKVLNILPENRRADYLLSKVGKTLINNKIVNGSQVAEILNTLPKSSRADFLLNEISIQFAMGKTKNSLDLHDILMALPQDNRIDFLVNKFGIGFAKSIIENGLQLTSILETLPEDTRVDCLVNKFGIEFAKNKIADGSQLASVLSILPENSQVDFLLNKFGIEFAKNKIANGSQLASVLGSLPKNSRFDCLVNKFGIEFAINKIKNHQPEDCSIFFREHTIIKNFPPLATILETLPEDVRLDCLVNKFGIEFAKNIIANGYQLANVLEVLPKSSRIDFLLNKFGIESAKNKIRDSIQLGCVLKALPEGNRVDCLVNKFGIEFAMNIIADSLQLAYVVTTLPKSEQVDFLLSEFGQALLRNKIPDGYHFARILYALAGGRDDRFSFQFNQDQLAISYQDLTLIAQFDMRLNPYAVLVDDSVIDNRVHFLSSTFGIEFAKNIIADGCQLAWVIYTLPEKNRVHFLFNAFGMEFANNKIADGYQLANVICALPENSHITFLSSEMGKVLAQNKIANGLQLAKVLYTLSESNRFNFLMSAFGKELVQSKTQDGDEFAVILETLVEDRKYNLSPFLASPKQQLTEEAFRTKFLANKFRMPHAQQRIVTENSRRVKFFQSLDRNFINSIIKNDAQKAKILNLLPESSRTNFSSGFTFFHEASATATTSSQSNNCVI